MVLVSGVSGIDVGVGVVVGITMAGAFALAHIITGTAQLAADISG